MKNIPPFPEKPQTAFHFFLDEMLTKIKNNNIHNLKNIKDNFKKIKKIYKNLEKVKKQKYLDLNQEKIKEWKNEIKLLKKKYKKEIELEIGPFPKKYHVKRKLSIYLKKFGSKFKDILQNLNWTNKLKKIKEIYNNDFSDEKIAFENKFNEEAAKNIKIIKENEKKLNIRTEMQNDWEKIMKIYTQKYKKEIQREFGPIPKINCKRDTFYYYFQEYEFKQEFKYLTFFEKKKKIRENFNNCSDEERKIFQNKKIENKRNIYKIKKDYEKKVKLIFSKIKEEIIIDENEDPIYKKRKKIKKCSVENKEEIKTHKKNYKFFVFKNKEKKVNKNSENLGEKKNKEFEKKKKIKQIKEILAENKRKRKKNI